MLQYQSAIMAQKVYFEPDQPYERRLFGAGAQDHRLVFQEPAYAIKQREAPADVMDDIDQVNKHSLNRVKKNINDYIMKNYQTIFTNRAVQNDKSANA